MNKSQQAFLDLLKTKNKVAVLLAPSFVVDFSFPEIILMLKDLGVKKVSEITYGAYLVNQIYNHYIQQNPEQNIFINTTCPLVVDFIKDNYPELSKYLLPEISCVMAFIKYFHTVEPDYKIVFVSPCLAKREFELDKLEEWQIALTYKELDEIFKNKKIESKNYKNKKADWDNLFRYDTKLYPIEGALSFTAKWEKIFPDFEIIVKSSLKNLSKVLDDIKSNKIKKALIDITACEGSCINGPGIISENLTLKERKLKVENYFQSFV